MHDLEQMLERVLLPHLCVFIENRRSAHYTCSCGKKSKLKLEQMLFISG
jgi:hypothetical protein